MEGKGKLHQQWGKWTDNPEAGFEGNREMIAGKIQEIYGNAKEHTVKRFRAFNRDCQDDSWI